ncbi:MAG TPA: hypothetical protein VHL79_05360 [Ramlibacter sp.]|jgi:hypothetical protein|nr:hypothetical protein [Ramlibacter sp.]
MNPVIVLLLGPMFIAYAAWILFSILLGGAFGRTTSQRMVIVVVLACLPIAYAELGRYQVYKNSKEVADENEKLVAQANEYLAQRCAQDRMQRAPQQVDPSKGLLLLVPKSEERLKIAGAQPPAPGSAQARNNQRLYGESRAEGFYEAQYQYPLNAIQRIHAGGLLLASPFEFVEGGDPLQATARQPRWIGPAKLTIVPTAREDLERGLANLATMPDRRESLTLPVMSSTARYVLVAEDISTLEDRQHWVARLHLRVLNRKSGEMAAEYVGFAADMYPVGGGYWEKVTVCPGKEREYRDREGRWDLMRFFFREVVSYKPELAR